MNRLQFTMGSDPEFVLSRNGKPFSAIGVVPGDRKKRFLCGEHQYYYDNVLAECAIKPGATWDEVRGNFQDCFSRYASLVKPFKLETWSYVKYPASQLTHKDARKAGCSEEHCPYLVQTMQPAQMEIKYEPYRSAGGHIHLGHNGHVQYKITKYKCDSFIGAWDAAKILDLFVGIPSLFMDDEPGSKERKSLYGQPGRYRKTPWGIEYRTLSNFWLKSPTLCAAIYELCEAALIFTENPENRAQLWDFDKKQLFVSAADCYHYKYPVEQVREAIQTHDCHHPVVEWVMNTIVSKFVDDEELIHDITTRKLRSSCFDFYRDWEINGN